MKTFVLIYKDRIEMNGKGVTSGIVNGVFTQESWRVLDALTAAMNQEFPFMSCYQIGIYFKGMQTGGYKMNLDLKDAPDSVLDPINDWIRAEVDIIKEEEYLDKVERDVREKVKNAWRVEDIKKMVIEALVTYRNNKEEYEDNLIVLDWLANSSEGIYMFENFLQRAGVLIPDSIHEHEDWCEITDSWMQLINDDMPVADCAVRFMEGGLALVYYPSENIEDTV